MTASGGAKLELAGLSAALGGASGGDNAVAGGLLNSGSHEDSPKPRFSPALAIQKHGTDAAFVTFTAGDGTGPWWVVIQRGFGPIYIEQVGLAVTMPSGQLGSRRPAARRQGQPAGADRRGRRPVHHLPGAGGLAAEPARLGGRPGRAGRHRRLRRAVPGRRPAQVPGQRGRGPVPGHAAGQAGRLRDLGLRRVRPGRAARRPVRLTVPVRRGERPDRRAAGLLRHRDRRRLRDQPRPDLPQRPDPVRRPTRSSRRSTRRPGPATR